MLDQNRFVPKLDSLQLAHDVVQPVVELFQATADAQNVKVKFESDIVDTAQQVDKTRVQQIVINLVSNAIKFSKPDDVIKI